MRGLQRRHLAYAGLVLAAAAALFWHARWFDFLCDDAFITLRYAKNLSSLGAPIYNVGERVEGYTNFLWMILAALGYRLGLEAEAIVALLGGLSALVLMGGLWLLWTRFEALPKAAGVLALAAVALSAPVAVWTLGGLETCLYAGLLVTSAALGAPVAARGEPRLAAALGLCLALSTLTRPEGAVAFAVAFGVTLAARARRPGAIATLAALVGAFVAVLGPYLLWRRAYYGDFLPNTFYLKTSGDAAALRANGVAYLLVAAKDFGWTWPLFALGLVAPAPRRLPGETADGSRARRACLWTLRLNVLVMLPYIASVGGDFLGGYRFLAPLQPLVIVLFAAAAAQWIAVLRRAKPLSIARYAPAAGALAGALLVAAYGAHQRKMGAVINAGSALASPPIRLEPLDWTRLHAKRWAAFGRWVKERAKPGDWMAIGAAGAAPYHAGINNLDLLGLCDRFIARHGIVVGSRPGHQRYAPPDYVLARSPVFLLYTGAFLTEKRVRPRRDPASEKGGYVWILATIDAAKYGSPDTYYFHFQLRTDRARELAGDPFIEMATTLP